MLRIGSVANDSKVYFKGVQMSKVTKSDKLLHEPQLSFKKELAIDAILQGKTDAEVAESLKLARGTVNRWKKHDLHFQAALNERRQEIREINQESVALLHPMAIDIIKEELKNPNSNQKVKIALTLIKLIQATASDHPEPTDPEEIILKRVLKKRRQAHEATRPVLDEQCKLPPIEEHMDQMRKEMEELAKGSDDSERDDEQEAER